MPLEHRINPVVEADAAEIAAVKVAPPGEDPAIVLRPGLVAYDAEWQFPAITEKHAYLQVARLITPVDGVCYLAFPWATLIDLLQTGGVRAVELKAKLWSLRAVLSGYKRIVTVCQHIHAARYVDLLLDVGVTDVFWSHATSGESTLGKNKTLRIRPFPLFPVQVPATPISVDSGPRRHLFSFVGAKANPDFYLTDSRTLILDELSKAPGGVVRARDEWHYEKVVYGHQILGRSKSAEGAVNEAWSAEFRDLLVDSTFTLCPSGSGPNSIRLWEALAAGSIPVVLADTWLPPGDARLWEVATVSCRETRSAIRELPARLAAIARDQSMLEKKRLAMRKLNSMYGPDCFVHDIRELYRRFAGDTPRSTGGMSGDYSWLSARAQDILKGSAGDADRRLFVISCTSRVLTDTDSFVRLCAGNEAFRESLRTQLTAIEFEPVALCRAALARKAGEWPELGGWFLQSGPATTTSAT